MAMRTLLNISRPSVPVEKGGNPILTFQDEVNKLFSDFFGEVSAPVWQRASQEAVVLTPAIDVSETDKEYRITTELPGLDVGDVQITAADGYVTIRGEKKAEKKEEKEGYFRRERTYGAFQRVIALPDTADLEHAEAKMDKGVLTLSIAKKAAAQSKERRIEIKKAA